MKKYHDELAAKNREVNYKKSWFLKSLELVHYLNWQQIKRVIDLGAGKGEFLELLKKRDTRIEYWGADYSETNIRELQAKNIKTLNIDFDDFQIKDYHELKEKFDLVTTLAVAEHIFNLDKFFQFINFILKTEGYLIVMTPNTASWQYKFFYLLRGYPAGENHHVRFLSKIMLKRYLFFNGFKIIKENNYFNWGSILIRRAIGLDNKYIIRFLTWFLFFPFYIFSKLRIFDSISNSNILILAKKSNKPLGMILPDFTYNFKNLNLDQQKRWKEEIKIYIKRDKIKDFINFRKYLNQLISE